MYQNVIFLISGCLLLGIFGTLAANRRVPPEERRQRWLKLGVYAGIVYAVLGALYQGWAFFGLAAAIVAVGAWELFSVWHRAPDQRAGTLAQALVVYGAFAKGFLTLALYAPNHLLLWVFVVVITFDGFSQIVGQLVGRHKLAPRVSPGKTVEGFLGGLVLATSCGLLFYPSLFSQAWQPWAWGALLCVGALAGDLLASAYKRACGVKDFSRLIPGHGGVLDRFDGLIGAGFLADILWRTGVIGG